MSFSCHGGNAGAGSSVNGHLDGLFKSGEVSRKVLLVPLTDVGVGNAKFWQSRKAIYRLADSPGELSRALDDCLREKEAWETQVGFSFVQTTLDSSVYNFFLVIEKEDSFPPSDPGVDGGGEISGLLSTHAGGLLLVAGDRTREMAVWVLDLRFNQSKRRSPPFTHCGLCASENRGSLSIDQGCNFLGIRGNQKRKTQKAKNRSSACRNKTPRNMGDFFLARRKSGSLFLGGEISGLPGRSSAPRKKDPFG